MTFPTIAYTNDVHSQGGKQREPHYIYDAQYRVVEERDGNEALLARYTYGSGMDEPLTMERGGETYYYHRDALGSITEVTDTSGTLVERYKYDVYGAVTIFDGVGITLTASAIGNPYLFTARRYDPESGNYTYRARMYSPWLGRFNCQARVRMSADQRNKKSPDHRLKSPLLMATSCV